MTTDTATTPEPNDPLPPLVGAIVDAHLSGWLDILHDVTGDVQEAEVLARTLARREEIRAELADPHGDAVRAAWEEAVGHLTYLADLMRADVERRRLTAPPERP